MTKPKPEYAWAVYGPKSELYPETIFRNKNDTIWEFTAFRDNDWQYYYKRGYRCRKVKIEVVDKKREG